MSALLMFTNAGAEVFSEMEWEYYVYFPKFSSLCCYVLLTACTILNSLQSS